MRIHGLQSTKEKPADIELKDKSKTNILFCTTVKPITTKEGNIYSDICGSLPTTSSRRNKYTYITYVPDCNSIMTTATKNIGEKEIILAFIESTEDSKICGINPGLHLIDNEASISLNMTMTTMNIKYQLVPPSNHKANHA